MESVYLLIPVSVLLVFGIRIAALFGHWNLPEIGGKSLK